MLDAIVSIGDTLKEIRETKGFHLQEVADKTSINYTSLSRIETGKRLPTKTQVQSLAEFYSYSENDLIRQLISDKIIYEVQNEDLGLEGFHLAEQKLKYGLNLFNDYKNQDKFQLQSRRYIGNKAKLTDWIMEIIESETEGNGTFIDIFSGTSIVAKSAMEKYKTVILNDILYSNNVTYQAFYGTLKWNSNKLVELANEYNTINSKSIRENYFSKNFGGKFYEKEVSKQIGYIRQDIEKKKKNNELNSREYAILLTSLIYTIDRLANTVGHFDAYIKKPIIKKPLNFKLIQTSDFKGAKIFQEDANELARNIKGDIAYIDPPYNSRQYSRFYHIYENLVQWKKPKLYGVALKPEPENMSKYCTVQAKDTFKDLVENLDVKYLAVSYNNTHKSKSKSSKNKITLEKITEILNNVGETKTFQTNYKIKGVKYIESLIVTKK
ncbi:DNA adenine methylase [Winogradskyella jejuensis]|uniref:site-specific DNA-methyltransferase (adenine-specific) n=1 Tax=Winogradskyella jejuensis TaxID=1089305 RepID=A0A1M5NDS1_9FLAO|nr:DNA adenine methylase [Winogradskyella jejuensis]SHG87133.1 adenine-specific DNA-methyltransferase [Winogradskyella jejuensis]